MLYEVITKESQTKHVAVGSKVEIKIDVVPDVVYTGVVSEISGATGAQYSLIPQDNSAGNFIKVEQLIPVKISVITSYSIHYTKLYENIRE